MRASCAKATTCALRVDLERHGKGTRASAGSRYDRALAGPKDKVGTIQSAAPKLASKGAPSDASTKGLAVKELVAGTVTVRSDIDGALELDRMMEAAPSIAACTPKKKNAKDIRGYWADWKLSAQGTAMEVMVKPFGGVDPTDETAAKCLRTGAAESPDGVPARRQGRARCAPRSASKLWSTSDMVRNALRARVLMHAGIRAPRRRFADEPPAHALRRAVA